MVVMQDSLIFMFDIFIEFEWLDQAVAIHALSFLILFFCH
jgi:hypothetical protein